MTTLDAEMEGHFALWPLKVRGRTARPNVSACFSGATEADRVGDGSKPVEGRSLADCGQLRNGHLGRLVTWRGERDPGHPDGEPVTLRLRLRSARLFSVRFA